MSQPSISKRAHQTVAVATLPLPVLATYALGRPVAALVPASLESPFAPSLAGPV